MIELNGKTAILQIGSYVIAIPNAKNKDTKSEEFDGQSVEAMESVYKKPKRGLQRNGSVLYLPRKV